MNVDTPWTVYRTRFVVRARQLTQPLSFVNALGREHSGQPGDYLVESPLGCRSILPQAQFEDIYVPLGGPLKIAAPSARPAGEPEPGLSKPLPVRSVGAVPGRTGATDHGVLAWSGSQPTRLGEIGRLAARGS